LTAGRFSLGEFAAAAQKPTQHLAEIATNEAPSHRDPRQQTTHRAYSQANVGQEAAAAGAQGAQKRRSQKRPIAR